jgi:hypothetical protein
VPSRPAECSRFPRCRGKSVAKKIDRARCMTSLGLVNRCRDAVRFLAFEFQHHTGHGRLPGHEVVESLWARYRDAERSGLTSLKGVHNEVVEAPLRALEDQLFRIVPCALRRRVAAGAEAGVRQQEQVEVGL